MQTDLSTGNPRSTFLSDVEGELSNIRTRVQDIGSRLQEQGFYAPPEEASKASTPPSENNTRSRIHDELCYLASNLGRVEHQLSQLV